MSRATPVAQLYPLRIGLIADVGQSDNASITRDQLAAHNPDVVLLNGDLSYADDYVS